MKKIGLTFFCVWIGSHALTSYSDDLQSQGLLTSKLISLNLAMQATRAALEMCAKHNSGVSVAVVDRDGVVRMLVRGDTAGTFTLEAARRKASTSANVGLASGKLAELLRARPDLSGMQGVDGILLLGGGLPILAGAETIGGIGVSGAPSAEADEECAQAGLDAIKGSLASNR